MSAIVARTEPPYFSFPPVRTRLLAQLTEQGRPPCKLVAVKAPTGYGKTVLLGTLHAHYRQAGCDCRWLALDERDRSIERVLTQLEDLLRDGDIAVDPQQALHQGDEPIESRLDAVIELIGAPPRPLVLFIDNINCCTDETLHRLIDALIFHTPQSVHLVFASTGELPFQESRAMLEGHLRMVRADELNLGVDEIGALFGAPLAARLGNAALASIARQTEGWPAAVRLMQILLSNADDPHEALGRFSGADEDLAALLNRQILQGFDPQFRRFLVEVALLRNFGVNLCRHALGAAAADAHVRLLLKRNLFIIPLDRRRSGYRLHSLFREFLLDEAERQVPAPRRAEILARAAEWCEHEGRWADAVEYAQAAGSVSLMAAILERVAALFVRDRGDLRQYIEWGEALQHNGQRGGWETDFWYVWALVFHRRYEYARTQMSALVARLYGEGAVVFQGAEAQDFRRRIEVIQIAIDVYTDRLEEARAQAQRWLAEAGGDDPFDVATVACAAAIERVSAFALVEARALVRSAQSAITQASSEYGRGWVALVTAMIAVQEGDYAAACRDLEPALARARTAVGEGAGITGTIALLAAKAAVETGLSEQAAEWLELGLRRAPTHGIVDTAAFGMDAAVKLWNGAADDTIAALREIAAAYPPRLALMLGCFTIRRLLRLGRVDEAMLQAGQLGLMDVAAGPVLAPACVRELVAATRIDLLMAGGRLKAAATLIDEETVGRGPTAATDARWSWRSTRRNWRWPRTTRYRRCGS